MSCALPCPRIPRALPFPSLSSVRDTVSAAMEMSETTMVIIAVGLKEDTR
jgi:hypothetical protein